ncbi:hypothetical protein E4U32_000232 [Claviceps aff. humidiphila group G2b]|nr:hypothetical protein E4U32_000232 [Claviceps aff. humidiphila group G2b]
MPVADEERSPSSRAYRQRLSSWDDDEITHFKPERWLKTRGEKTRIGAGEFDIGQWPMLSFGAGQLNIISRYDWPEHGTLYTSVTQRLRSLCEDDCGNLNLISFADTEPDDLEIGSDFTPFVSGLWLQKNAAEAFSWYPIQRRYWNLWRLTGTSKSQQKWKHPTLVMEYIKKTQLANHSSVLDSIREAICDNI